MPLNSVPVEFCVSRILLIFEITRGDRNTSWSYKNLCVRLKHAGVNHNSSSVVEQTITLLTFSNSLNANKCSHALLLLTEPSKIEILVESDL